MGNVVSSLLMYTLQAAWFCQRLIDQDYRQNHGSRSKPIMDIDETDLDVFLSQCRSYYMSKNKRNSQIEYVQRPVMERTKKKWVHRRTRVNAEDSKVCPSPHLVHSKSGFYAPISKYLTIESEGSLSKMDQELVSRETDFTRLLMNENDFDGFPSKPCKISEKRENSNERNKSGSSKTERWKRKKLYYRERYNPKSGQNRTVDTFNIQKNDVLAIDGKDIDSASRDESLNFNNKDSNSVGQGEEKRVTEANTGSDRYLERTTSDAVSHSEVSGNLGDHGFTLVVENFDLKYPEKDHRL